MPDLVENNIKKQKDDALKFISQESGGKISKDLIEKIYDVVRESTTNQTIDVKNELKKIIEDEVSKKWKLVALQSITGWYLKGKIQ